MLLESFSYILIPFRKLCNRTKRHISVDILGLPHAVHVTTANVTDRKGALEMYEQYPEWKETIEAILTDGGYTGAKFQKEIQKLLNAEVQVAKRSELHQFQVIPKRWIVERAKVGRSFICCENRWCFKSFHKHIGGLMISYFTELNIHGVPFSINRTICHVLSKIQIPRDKFKKINNGRR